MRASDQNEVTARARERAAGGWRDHTSNVLIETRPDKRQNEWSPSNEPSLIVMLVTCAFI